MKRSVIVFSPLFLMIAVLLSGCSSDQKVDASAPAVVRNLSVVTAATASVPDVLEAVGTVRAFQTSQLASQATGTITQVRVREGDRVRRGEILAVIDEAAPTAALERALATEAAAANELTAAESDLALAESTLARYQTLFDKEIISRQQFDELKARRQSALAHRDLARATQIQARAAVTEARAVLGFARVIAPFDGIVAERKLDPGAMASPGLPILTVEDVSRYRLEASVNENDLRYVHIGDRVPVSIDSLGNSEFSGRVAQIVPAADAASRTFVVKVELPGNKALRSGLFGHGQFTRGQKTSLLLPQTAVIERGQLHAAYVLDQSGVSNLRYVTLGRPTGTQVEILAGVQNGERVVAQPGELDLSGKRIEAQP
jgi:membrane fusion protein, multidrug efflux system